MIYVFYFIVWTLILYLLHRLAHINSFLWQYHNDHHTQINFAQNKGKHWSNYFLFFDTWKSTVDQWLIEILPTIIFCMMINDWFIFVFYYFWAVWIQEKIKHDNNFNIYPVLTSGQWHMVHHKYYGNNFGVFVPIWDILFKTHRTHIGQP